MRIEDFLWETKFNYDYEKTGLLYVLTNYDYGKTVKVVSWELSKIFLIFMEENIFK